MEDSEGREATRNAPGAVVARDDLDSAILLDQRLGAYADLSRWRSRGPMPAAIAAAHVGFICRRAAQG